MDKTTRKSRSRMDATDDLLLELELRVAQRADELARVSPCGGSARRDRETWTRAEVELLPLLTAGRGAAA